MTGQTNVLCPHNETLFSLKREIQTHATTQVSLENIMLSKTNQTQILKIPFM
jgi:hypothetical protein